ncbi:MAG TPA: TraR/DksA family transcriptional regulator [Elusimicrobiales bacterium]|nr:TraR/DksA family transcriptional regulator [Elusimicrobiales bacterium]
MKTSKKSVKKPANKTAKKTAAKKPAAKKTTAKKPAPQKAAVKTRPEVKKAAKPAAAPGKLTSQELAAISATLNEMKTNIAKNVEDKKNLDMVEPDGGDSIDLATRSLDKEILFELSDNERKMLGDIEAALRKMEKGTYGLCEHCKNSIEKKRIKALPSARYCITCQSGTELKRRE